MKTAKTEVQKQQRRQDILTAARELLTALPVSALTMQMIASEVQVSRRTLFNYYPTRDSLLMSLLIHDFLNYVSELVQNVEQYQTMNGTDLKKVLLGHLTRLYLPEHRALLKLIQARATLLQKADSATHQRDRNALVDSAVTLGQVLKLRLPLVTADQVLAIFYTENALILGYSNLALPNNPRQIKQRYHVNVHPVDAQTATVRAFEHYLDGIL